MRTTTRQAITRRMTCCVGWVLLGGVLAGCSSPATQDAARTSGSTSAASRSASATHTVRDGRTVVSGDAPEARLRTVARDAGTAAARVRKMWGESVLSAPVHIDVPADDAGFRARGGSVEPGAQVAATTTASGRVVLAPSLFTEVTGQGVVVVLTHELTHVALHQFGDTDIDRWVVEGAAEFTAYQPTGLTLPRLTPQLAASVRAGHAPTGPPSDARFRDDPQAAYQEAYAWCLFLVDRFGSAEFTRFARSDRARRLPGFTAVFGVSIDSLRRSFDAFLRAQVMVAGASSGSGG